MPVHDWNRVTAGTFHDFHLAWIAELRRALNGGLLPQGYYAVTKPALGKTVFNFGKMFSRLGQLGEKTSARQPNPFNRTARPFDQNKFRPRQPKIPSPRTTLKPRLTLNQSV